jgi:type II secretory pathway component GspD/PulD (secretin)
LPHVLTRTAAILLLASTLAACAAGRAFRRGEEAARVGDWDQAVVHFTRAVQEAPDRAEYRITLERSMLNASRAHQTRAKDFEASGQLDAALLEYRKAAEFDPTNRLLASKVAELERVIRERVEAARPRPQIEQLRERVRQASPEPILSPTAPLPALRFTDARIRDILNFIGSSTGINVLYDQGAPVDKPYSIELSDATIEQALNQIMTANQLFYKVINERTILVIQDTPQKRAQFEEQVIRTFYISHADPQELSQLLSQLIRVPGMPVQPMVAVNKTSNTITIRATTAVASVIERIIAANDKPRAEIVIDVEILEVSRQRAKQLGVNLTSYALGGIFSPEVAPPNESTAPTAVASPPPFNLNTISQGISTADFYLAVPAAFVRFLASDSRTKLIAKPQLRGAEGQKLTLNLGDRIPVPSTIFGTQGGPGSVATVPISSFNYEPVGVNVEMTPRVTFEGEIVLELLVESSTLGTPILVAGQALPTFGSRKVTTKLRLREGESNLLAGLLREDERRALRGIPGLIRLPILRQLTSDDDSQITQTDIVMLMTPHIVRTHELTERDLSPIYIGTQQNIGLTGPPPLIAPVEGEPPPGGAAPPPEAGVQPPVTGGPPGTAGVTPETPPGTLPRPGVLPESAPTPPPAPAPSPTEIVPPPPQPTPAPAVPETPGAPPPAPPVPAPSTPTGPAAPPAAAAQIVITPPGTEFRVGAGPYTVPISINGARQASLLTLTLTFNPGILRPQSVQEGSFMRQGGTAASFTQKIDPAAGRIDITITRPGDTVGATGSGLLAAVVFDAVAAGTATLSASGVASSATGASLTLQFSPVTVTVR